MLMSRQVQLRSRPSGSVRADDFALVSVPLPDLKDGEVLVRNQWMSVDPYMRLRLGPQQGYLPPVRPGDVMEGAAVGIVERSRDTALPEGLRVTSNLGWRSHFIARREDLTPIEDDAPGPWLLGYLGLTGMTAWLGIESVLQPRAGETLFISGAAGAVGSIACQLARRRGARVLGSAGSAERSAWLRETLGLEAVHDRHAGPLDEFLARHAPQGLDCLFDNAGGAMLDALLLAMNPHGRVGLCGAMARYETEDYRSGPANFFTIIEKSLGVHGFNAFLMTPDEQARARLWLRQHAENGEIVPHDTCYAGLDKAPEAFAGLFRSGHVGKAVVQI